MEQTLCQLIDFIKEKMPSLSVIDEDYGQLENIEDGKHPKFAVFCGYRIVATFAQKRCLH